MKPMYEQALQLGFWTLFLTGLARLFITSLLLSTGWKGGQFLPIMFGSTALGLSFSVLFPVIPMPVAVLSMMGALIAVVLPKPFISLILMALMFPIEYIGISVVSVGMVMLAKYLWQKGKAPESASAELAVASD